jgi:hypothetical protein
MTCGVTSEITYHSAIRMGLVGSIRRYFDLSEESSVLALGKRFRRPSPRTEVRKPGDFRS